MGLSQASFSQQTGSQQFGLNIHNSQPANALESEILPTGLTIRADFRWSTIEDAKKGVLTFPASYSEFDSVVTRVTQSGARPLIILCFGNKYYDDGEQPHSTEAIEAFARYARFIVNHFKGRANQFEVWNEWNYNSQSKKQPHVWGDAGDYVNLLRVVSAAIKSEDPHAIVVGGTPGGTDENWINKFMQSGGLAYVNAFAIHPYVLKRMHAKDASSFVDPAQAYSKTSMPVPGTPEDSMAWIDHIKARIDKNAGHRVIPIYVTENGWPTNIGDRGVPENIEASYLQRFLLLARTRPWLGGVWWYELMDDGPKSDDPEQRFGILRQNGEPKAAYHALIQIKSILESKSTPSETVGSNGEITVSGVDAANKKFCVAWISTDDFTRSQPSSDINTMIHSGYHNVSTAANTSLSGTPLILTK